METIRVPICGTDKTRTVETNNGMWCARELWRRVWELLPPGPVGRQAMLVDVGCAHHGWTCDDYWVFRVDANEDVRQASETPLTTGNLNETWPLTDDKVDVVTAVEVIEHVENPWHFLREATRVARQCVVLTTPNPECDLGRQMFSRHGVLFGFTAAERAQALHKTPIFSWQLEAMAAETGWRLAHLGGASPPADHEPLAAKGVAALNDDTLVTNCAERRRVAMFLAPGV
jgi:hypothetical protein